MSDGPIDHGRRIEERLRPGRALAKTLLGLPRTEAVERATAAGFRVEIFTPDAQAVSADLRFDRVRIETDDAGVVREAHAG